MTNHRNDAEQQAARELEKLRHEGDAIGGIFSRTFGRPAGASDDAIELWGTRIGRALSVVALAVLCMYVFWTYFR